jgi:tRNA (guanine37-N1)-methyltransferase
MRIDVFTIFPDLVEGFAGASLLGRARQKALLDVRVHDLRATTTDVHRTVDDSPFGGGAGMVLMPEPVFAAVEAAEPPRPLYLLGPGGRRLDQALARELAAGDGFSLLCGRYEGVDARVRDHLVDGELSVGDYVLAGGEVAAMVVLEAVGRLVPGVMGNDTSADEESFSDGLLEYPQYTQRRPRADRSVAAGPGPGPDGAGPARSGRCQGRPERRRPGPVGKTRLVALTCAVPREAVREPSRHEVH